jgi:hypothetical protein
MPIVWLSGAVRVFLHPPTIALHNFSRTFLLKARAEAIVIKAVTRFRLKEKMAKL